MPPPGRYQAALRKDAKDFEDAGSVLLIKRTAR